MHHGSRMAGTVMIQSCLCELDHRYFSFQPLCELTTGREIKVAKQFQMFVHHSLPQLYVYRVHILYSYIFTYLYLHTRYLYI